MGYCMHKRESSFYIAQENCKNALEAIKGLAGKETYGDHYSWVDTNAFLNAKHFDDAMCKWRWEVEEDDNENIIDIDFIGEKLGDDFKLFKAIAPFVKEGSYIEMYGEDGCFWRWCFDGQTCVEKQPSVVW